MHLKLKPQISPFHLISYYLMTFTILLVVQFIISFLIFILKSPKYYNIPSNLAGTVSGDCGFYAEICVILLDLVLGVIFDTIGRKTPTVIGLIVAGTSIIGTPFFTEVYPGFLLMRIFMSLGIIPGVNTPLLPDYVQEKSLGLASAYVSFNWLIWNLVKRSKCTLSDYRIDGVNINFDLCGLALDLYWHRNLFNSSWLVFDCGHQRCYLNEKVEITSSKISYFCLLDPWINGKTLLTYSIAKEREKKVSLNSFKDPLFCRNQIRKTLR